MKNLIFLFTLILFSSCGDGQTVTEIILDEKELEFDTIEKGFYGEDGIYKRDTFQGFAYIKAYYERKFIPIEISRLFVKVPGEKSVVFGTKVDSTYSIPTYGNWIQYALISEDTVFIKKHQPNSYKEQVYYKLY